MDIESPKKRSFTETIKLLRDVLNLTQAELAEKLSYNKAYVTIMESGNMLKIRPFTFYRFVKAGLDKAVINYLDGTPGSRDKEIIDFFSPITNPSRGKKDEERRNIVKYLEQFLGPTKEAIGLFGPNVWKAKSVFPEANRIYGMEHLPGVWYYAWSHIHDEGWDKVMKLGMGNMDEIAKEFPESNPTIFNFDECGSMDAAYINTIIKVLDSYPSIQKIGLVLTHSSHLGCKGHASGGIEKLKTRLNYRWRRPHNVSYQYSSNAGSSSTMYVDGIYLERKR